MRNWKTTLTGVLVIIVALSKALLAEVDGDPTTSGNWNDVAIAVIGVLTGAGLIAASDSKKEDDDGSSGFPPMGALLLPVLICLTLLVGCTPRTELITLRESMAAVALPAIDENVEVAKALRDKGERTENDVTIRQNTQALFNRLIEQSRQEDTAGIFARP